MHSMRRQRGLSFIGLVIVLGVGGFFAYCGMKLFPVYSEYHSVKESMDALTQEPGIANAAPKKIRDLLSRRFEISYVESVKPENITITAKSGVQLTVNYEVRRPLFYNLDFVAKFDYMVELAK
ncbi:MAG: DUF4845 domain-containing protein [Xanthomonadales bacterium]|nr:DUF4845 domain-containing protein [Xanthomonadales bacterium]